MDGREAKLARLAELKATLVTVDGTPTEVYSRIVGYYRSVRNWNPGKREEFGRRKEYAFPGLVPAVPQGIYTGAHTAGPNRHMTSSSFPSTGADEPVGNSATEPATAVGPATDAGRIASYLLFTRKSCPNCPPVAAAIASSGLDGISIDVDTSEGMTMASSYSVMATPTVIVFDDEGRELGRAFTKPQLTSLLAPVRETVLA